MGKVYKIGEGAFRGIYSKEQLEKLGYISGKKAHDLILIHLCDGTYNNGGLEKFKKYTVQMAKILDKVQIGEGHSTRSYYKENEVVAFIQSILNGDKDILVLTQKTEDLKSQGYISGVIVGNMLYKVLKDICDSGKEKKDLSQWYQSEFKNIKRSVDHKTVGVGKATRHYYSEKEVKKYIADRIVSAYFDVYK